MDLQTVKGAQKRKFLVAIGIGFQKFLSIFWTKLPTNEWKVKMKQFAAKHGFLLHASIVVTAMIFFAIFGRDAPIPGNQGFWAKTATIDWCEKNYAVSHYIAEFWNTLTALMYLIFFVMIERQLIAKNLHAHVGLQCSNFIHLVVGIGTMLFHGTLSRWAQLLDEIPMIFLIISVGFNILSPKEVPIFGILGAVLVSFILVPKISIVFQLGFASAVVLTAVRFYREMSKRKDTQALFEKMTKHLTIATLFWVIDQTFCNQSQIFGLQLFHGFWHVMTSVVLFELFQLLIVVKKTKLDASILSNKAAIDQQQKE